MDEAEISGCDNASVLATFKEHLLDIANVSVNDDFARFFCLGDESQRGCLVGEWTAYPPTHSFGDLCEPQADGVNCWTASLPNTTAHSDCPLEEGFKAGPYAFRHCLPNATWTLAFYEPCLTNEMADYFSNGTDTSTERWLQLQAMVLKDIYFYGSSASLLMLVATLALFCSLKSLQCARIHIHKNLVISFILNCIVNIICYEPYIYWKSDAYADEPFLCKAVHALLQYTLMTNVFWTFVEGLYMYCKIAVAVFSMKTPYVVYHAIGWGFPAVCVLAWALCMHNFHDEQTCWRGYSSSNYFWIIAGPIILAISANMFFLVNIVRVVVTKLSSACSAENMQIRKAMKATAVLLPLLSITNLIFVTAPTIHKSPEMRLAYTITNAVLQTTQGMLVSILYCFFNGEVRAALVRSVKQLKESKMVCRRTSSCVTQTDILLKKCLVPSVSKCIVTDTGSCVLSSDGVSSEQRA